MITHWSDREMAWLTPHTADPTFWSRRPAKGTSTKQEAAHCDTKPSFFYNFSYVAVICLVTKSRQNKHFLVFTVENKQSLI